MSVPDLRVFRSRLDSPEGDVGWFDPDTSTIWLERDLRGRELVVTVLHEVAHWLRGDDSSIADDVHDAIEAWAVAAAATLP